MRGGRQDTAMLFEELKQMTDCTLIGYRMGDRGDLGRAMGWPFQISYDQRELLKVSLRKEKCASIKDTYGYDILFLIRADSLNIVTDDDEDENAPQRVFDMNDKKAMRQMQKEYSKASAARRDSRVFVNKFTEIIA